VLGGRCDTLGTGEGREEGWRKREKEEGMGEGGRGREGGQGSTSGAGLNTHGEKDERLSRDSSCLNSTTCYPGQRSTIWPVGDFGEHQHHVSHTAQTGLLWQLHAWAVPMFPACCSEKPRGGSSPSSL
jgi:hypothetical protein